MQINAVLTHELQLKNKLNQLLQQEQRADFAFLLSLLSWNANDFSAFRLPHTEIAAQDQNTETLRQSLELGEIILGAKHPADFSRGAKVVRELAHGTAAMKLQLYLSNSPIHYQDDPSYIAPEVLSNTQIHALDKYHQEKEKRQLREKQPHQYPDLYEVVNDAKDFLSEERSLNRGIS
ncbi:VC2046/SO_2500 family protein [Algicola sagamiensis]|uniref:VC2046/SO_2500 family protein n=1 Tax=Algicola sagamiensis TaxID=163869 RepID=UPI000366B7B7|nr:VC2046/SO_2500 family protein [Algicola sagamiensis]